MFKRTPGVVDIDWYVEDARPKERFAVDKEKAALVRNSIILVDFAESRIREGMSAEQQQRAGWRKSVVRPWT